MAFEIQGTSPTYNVALCVEKAWTVCLACEACARPAVEWRGEELARLPAGATLGAIAARAKCGGCGSTTGRLYTRQGYWGARTAFARG